MVAGKPHTKQMDKCVRLRGNQAGKCRKSGITELFSSAVRIDGIGTVCHITLDSDFGYLAAGGRSESKSARKSAD